MAFVMLKNVFLTRTLQFQPHRSAFRAAKCLQVAIKPSHILLKSSNNSTRHLSLCSHKLCLNFSSTAASHGTTVETNLNFGTSQSIQQEDGTELDNSKKLLARPTRFKRKTAFLQHLHEQLSKDEALTTKEAFVLLKFCDSRMVGETDATRNDLVTYVWENLEKKGVALQTGLWNTLLSVYIDNRHDFEPLEFLKRLWEKSDIEPNKTTFSLLIQAYAAKGDPVGAMKIVEFMMANNDAQMTEHIYAWLIKAFAKKGDLKGVQEILNSMSENNIKAKHSTYNNLIAAHAERGDFDSINQVVQEMIQKRLYPTSETYLSLLDHLSLGGHHELIPVVWQRIDSIEYLNQDINSLTQRCITRGDYQSAIHLLFSSIEQLSKRQEGYHNYVGKRLFNNLLFSEKDSSEFLIALNAFEKHLSLTPLSKLTILLDVLLSKDRSDMIFKILNKAYNDGNVLEVQIFHGILQRFADKKNINGIMDVYKFMENKNIIPDYYCYRAIEPLLSTPGNEESNELLSKLKELKNLKLSVTSVGKIIESDNVELHQIGDIVENAPSAGLFASLKSLKKLLLEDFNIDDASKIITSLHRRGMNNASVLIDELLHNLLNDPPRKIEESLLFLQKLMENDVPISSVSYTRMLKVLHAERMSDEFFMFVRLMKQHGFDPDVHQYYQMLKMAATVGNSMAAQFCFDKVMESGAFPNRKNELYEYLIAAYTRDTEKTKIIPAHIIERESENAVKVIQLFKEMEEKNYRPSPATITQIIRSYLLNLDIDGAKDIIREYGEGKEEYLKVVKNSFMRAYVARKDFEAAESLFEEQKQGGVVTALQYNEMMRACEYTGDTIKVENLFKEMVENGLRPNVFSYLHRIRAFIASKDPEPCIGIMEENIASGMNVLRVDIFMTVLRYLIPTGNIENVKKVIDLIKEHHSSKVPPKRLEHALILVNIKAGKIDEASKLLPISSENPDKSVEIELNPYRKVAKTAMMEEDIGYIENIIQFLKVNNLNYQSVDTFYLQALDNAGDKDRIRRLYQERLEQGVTPSGKFMMLLCDSLGEEEVQQLTNSFAK